jgi:hypothetical protein
LGAWDTELVLLLIEKLFRREMKFICEVNILPICCDCFASMIDSVADPKPLILIGYSLDLRLSEALRLSPFYKVLLECFWLDGKISSLNVVGLVMKRVFWIEKRLQLAASNSLRLSRTRRKLPCASFSWGA